MKSNVRGHTDLRITAAICLILISSLCLDLVTRIKREEALPHDATRTLTSTSTPGKNTHDNSLGGYRFSLHQLKDWATRVDPSVNETPDDNELDEGEHYCNDEIDYRATCLLAVEEYCIQKYRRRVTFVADASGSGLAALVVTKQRRPYDGETEKIIKRFVLEGEKDLKVKEALERDEKLDVELITAYVG